MKKSLLCKVLAVAALFAACVPAFAGKYDSWPEKDVHIIYYTRPGSGGDTFLRNLAVAVKDKLNGHSIVIENIIDPSGAVPWGRVQRAPKDGYTLACLSTTVVTADLIGHSPVKYPDFAYICALGNDPQYIFSRKEMPFNTLPELLAYAKANPGKLNWGTAAPTSASTICSAEIIRSTGIDVNRIVFNTGGDTLVNILGGFCDIGVGEYMDMRPQIEAGNLKLLALVAKERNVLNVPTTVEDGFNIVFERARGLAAPAGTDPELVERMAEVFKTALSDEKFCKYLSDEAIEAKYMNGAEFLASYDQVAKTIKDNEAALRGKKQ
jgi:tripartite-type tricarboxylate transporter receptor subunit TctC